MLSLEQEQQNNAEYVERVKERLITAVQYIREEDLKIGTVESLLSNAIDDIMNAIDKAEHEGLNSIPHLYTSLYFAMLAYSNYDQMQTGDSEQAALEWSVKDESGTVVWAHSYNLMNVWKTQEETKFPQNPLTISCNATDLMLKLKNISSKEKHKF